MAMEENKDMLAPPAVSQLRAQAGGQMERSLSADIREEREDLREAAEQTLNVIMDLSLDGRDPMGQSLVDRCHRHHARVRQRKANQGPRGQR